MASSLGFGMAKTVQNTIFPPIPQAYKWIASFKGKRPLLNMSQGVPGVPPPVSVQTALGNASSSSPSFGYTQVVGDDSLRTALAEEMKFAYQPELSGTATVVVEKENIALTSGCNLAFVAVMLCVATKDDEVILPVPWYFNHQMTLTLHGIKPIPLQTLPEDGFVPSVEACEKLITPKTKAIALVTPNNPTGATYPPDLLASFLELAAKHNIALVLDETYRDFIPSGAPHTLFSSPTWSCNLIHLFSFSKSYCLPGHRLGAIVASPEFINGPLTKVLDTYQICAPRPIQLALGSMLPPLRGFIREQTQGIQVRHKIFRECLPGTWKIGSQGGYYAFVRHPFKGKKALEVCEKMVQDIGLVVLPEEFFCEESPNGGSESRWVRFSVANVDDEKVRDACKRLEECETLWGWERD
ncbi:pyridoxal phosphate-dependent transferase [Flagelloscypha sp. PMI_526]|nr:pyridoxal phosphate-dependent transferase [Flagelloscypha sp. PMI_526]